MKKNIAKNTLSFSCSKSMKWIRTPVDIWEDLSNEFNFTLDACASDDNHLLPRYYTKDDSCLDKDWTDEVVYCHPMFDIYIGKFVEKCYNEKCISVMLLPASTHTRYFHKFIYHNPNVEIRFLEKPTKGFRFLPDVEGYIDDLTSIGYIKALMVIIFRNGE